MKTRIDVVTKNVLSQGEDKYPTDSNNVVVIDVPFLRQLHHYKVNSKNDGVEPRTKAEIDATPEELGKVKKIARVARIKAQLINKTRSQLSAYVDSKVADAGTAEVLKNIILLLKDNAEEKEG